MKEKKQSDPNSPRSRYESYSKRVKIITTIILILCIMFGVNLFLNR